MTCYKRQNLKFYLSGIFALFVCFLLHAEGRAKSAIYHGNDSTCIYIAENAKIYGRELLFVKQTKVVKKTAKVKKEEPAPEKNKITEQEPTTVVFPTFPFVPSSSSFSQGGSESAAISLQQRMGGDEQACKASGGNSYPCINDLNLSFYRLEQRQKLSIAATQCGELTSFGAQSPPAFS